MGRLGECHWAALKHSCPLFSPERGPDLSALDVLYGSFEHMLDF